MAVLGLLLLLGAFESFLVDEGNGDDEDGLND